MEKEKSELKTDWSARARVDGGVTSRKGGIRQEAKQGSGRTRLGKKTVGDCRHGPGVLELTPKAAKTEEKNHQGMKIQQRRETPKKETDSVKCCKRIYGRQHAGVD